jgi:hypothetical protein
MTSNLRLLSLLCATAAVAVGAAGCHPAKLADVKFGENGGVHVSSIEPLQDAVTVGARLDCPAHVGTLKRTAIAADGASCDYASDKGRVHLATLNAQTDPKAALSPLRDQLDSELPGVAEKATIQVVSEKSAGGAEHTKVDMPFLHVEDDGEHSRVRLLGMDIQSDSKRSKRAKAEDSASNDTDGAAASTTPLADRGVKLVYVLVSGKASPDGFHVLGYVAKGPPKGKLVVATFRYRSGEKRWSDGDRNDDDIDALMALNVKPAA